MNQQRDWLTLDNAAKIYPAVSPVRSPAVFRLQVSLDHPVRLDLLQKAMNRALKRCPYYQVQLKRGFFWYYLQTNQMTPDVKLLDSSWIPPLSRRSPFLLRVLARGHTVAVDFSHILTDGKGGLTFLFSLVADYLRSTGVTIPLHPALLNLDEAPDPGEFEDAHRKNFQDDLPAPPFLGTAWHMPDKPAFHERFRMLHGVMPVAPILAVAKQKGVSLTEYLVALMMYSLLEVRRGVAEAGKKQKHSVVRLEVPVNMRAFHPSNTMRNFSLYVSPEIDARLGDWEFDDVLKRVHHSMRMQIDGRELNRHISRNVGAELNPLIRFLPLLVKDTLLNSMYSRLGENMYTSVLSNVGRIEAPDELLQRLRRLRVIIAPNHVMRKSCAIVTLRNEISISFSSVIESNELERRFFSYLAGQDIPIKVLEE